MIHVIPSRRVNGFISIGRTCGENKTKYSVSDLSGENLPGHRAATSLLPAPGPVVLKYLT